MTDSTASNVPSQSGAQVTPAERITVALIPKAAEDLQRLQDRTGMSKTDIVNRAVTLYQYIDAQLQANRDLLIKDNHTGEHQRIVLL